MQIPNSLNANVKTNRKTLLFVIPTLGHGGAQKVLTDLLHYLISTYHLDDNYNFHLLTFRQETAPIHKAHPSVNLEFIDVINRTSMSVLPMIGAPFKIRRVVQQIKPDLIVAFQDIANFATILANIGSKIPIIISERNDPQHYNMALARTVMRNLLYPLATRIVVQTDCIANQMPRTMRPRTTLIPNAVPEAPLRAATGEPLNGMFTVICAGRLEAQKDHQLLIDAFAILKPNNSNWCLRIYGEGSLRTELETKISKLNLVSHASIEPPTKNIFKALSQSHILVLSSAHEGFPNILAEAVAAGLPCIGYKSVSGVPELIQNRNNGILLKDNQRNAHDLAHAMASLMNDADKRRRMSDNCAAIASKFKPESVYDKWHKLIFGITNQ